MVKLGIASLRLIDGFADRRLGLCPDNDESSSSTSGANLIEARADGRIRDSQNNRLPAHHAAKTAMLLRVLVTRENRVPICRQRIQLTQWHAKLLRREMAISRPCRFAATRWVNRMRRFSFDRTMHCNGMLVHSPSGTSDARGRNAERPVPPIPYCYHHGLTVHPTPLLPATIGSLAEQLSNHP